MKAKQDLKDDTYNPLKGEFAQLSHPLHYWSIQSAPLSKSSQAVVYFWAFRYILIKNAAMQPLLEKKTFNSISCSKLGKTYKPPPLLTDPGSTFYTSFQPIIILQLSFKTNSVPQPSLWNRHVKGPFICPQLATRIPCCWTYTLSSYILSNLNFLGRKCFINELVSFQKL